MEGRCGRKIVQLMGSSSMVSRVQSDSSHRTMQHEEQCQDVVVDVRDASGTSHCVVANAHSQGSFHWPFADLGRTRALATNV